MFRAAWLAFLVVAAGGLAAQEPPLPRAPRPAEPPPAADTIEAWVKQLADDRFWSRELASKRLAAAGAVVVPAVERAAHSGDPEVATRCVNVLYRISLSDDLPGQAAAFDALERLAGTRGILAAAQAAHAVSGYAESRREAALAAIRRNGAVMNGESATINVGFSGENYVIIGKDWTGGTAGLAHFRWVTDVSRLGIHSVRLDGSAVPHLKQLKHLARLELYGTRLKPEHLFELKQALPEVDIDVRSGALLGIAGVDHERGCLVARVQPGSAAEAAGLQNADVITRFNGKPFAGFVGLTALISEFEGGERVGLEYERDGETRQAEVELGSWQ